MNADPEGTAAPTGPQEARCGAIKHRNSKGEPDRWCRKYPRKGQARCEDHGGNAPQALAAAERRQQETAARAYVARYGMPQHIEWHQAIQEGLDETYGAVLALRDLVRQLRPEALTWGIAQVVEVGSSQFPGIDTTQAAGIAPIVQLYGQERDRLHRMAVDAGKLGLEVRRQQLAERDAGLVFELIRDVLAALGRDLADPEVQRVLAERLAPLSIGSAA